MSSRNRLTVSAFLGSIALLATATPATAQFYGGAGYAGTGGFNTHHYSPVPRSWFALPPVRPVSPLPGVNGFNPLMFSPFNPVYDPRLQNAVNYYYFNRLTYGPPAYSPYSSPYTSISGYGSYSGPSAYNAYMTGGVRNPAVESAYRDFGKAQQHATEARSGAPAARQVIDYQRAYEQRAPITAPAAKPGEETPPLAKALAAANPTELASGDVLNQILAAAIATEGNGGKVDSAFLPPNLLADVRFAGGPNGDALNLLRTAGKMEFPAAFDSAPLAALRPAIERDFASAAAPVLVGKPAEPVKVAALEMTVRKTEQALAPQIKDLPFEDATAARRFLNQLDATVKVLKTVGAVGLVNPRWAGEGTSVADLVAHMAKYKLQFGPVPSGHEEVYVALHRGLSNYLFARLGQTAPPPKKP